MSKPIIRTVHHLSCTGGTLISKCIACMPNVALISETHPFVVGKTHFNPIDPIQQLFSQGLVSDKEEALKYVFRSRIEAVSHLSKLEGRVLILRDHTHSDYLGNNAPQNFRLKSVLNCLKYEFDIKSVMTLRNPVDTYLSLKKNGWSNGVKSFDEYCKRIILMLNAYKSTPHYHYEDFCLDPDAILDKICNNLDIEFDPSYKDRFFNKILTGNSGRGKEITEIKPLPHREYDEEYLSEVYASENFKIIAERQEYSFSL